MSLFWGLFTVVFGAYLFTFNGKGSTLTCVASIINPLFLGTSSHHQSSEQWAPFDHPRVCLPLLVKELDLTKI